MVQGVRQNNVPGRAIETCATCICAEEVRDPTQIGRTFLACHRYPPQIVVVHTPQGVQIMSQHPMVQKDTTACFEYHYDEGDGDQPVVVTN